MKNLLKYLLTIFLASGIIIGIAYAGNFPTALDNFVNNATVIRAVDIDNIQYIIGETGTTSPATLQYLVKNTNSNNVTYSGKLTITSATTTNSTLTNFWSTNGQITNASTTYGTIPTLWSTTGTITTLAATRGTITNATSSNSLFIPNGAGFLISATGQISIDTTSGNFKWQNSATTTQALSATSTKGFTIASTTASELVPIVQFDQPVNIQKVLCGVVGGTSVTFNLQYGTDVSAAGTSVFSSNQVESGTTAGTTYYPPAMAANTPGALNWLWVKTSAVSGTIRYFNCTVYYRL